MYKNTHNKLGVGSKACYMEASKSGMTVMEKNKFVIICHAFVPSLYHFECIAAISYFGPKGKGLIQNK